MERQFHAQGHGEYREIVEEEFLKEVCGSLYVVVHFFHPEFFNCKIVDKHMRVRAPPRHLALRPTHASGGANRRGGVAGVARLALRVAGSTGCCARSPRRVRRG